MDSTNSDFTEKRIIERKYLVFYLRVFDGMSIKVLGHVVNLSSRGVMLLSDSAIPVNEDYRLRMKLPKEICERDELLVDATSRWCKKDANPDFYLTGFQVDNLTPSDTNDILKLLDEFSI